MNDDGEKSTEESDINSSLSLYLKNRANCQTNQHSPTSWRTRDPIYSLIACRRKILETRNISHTHDRPSTQQEPSSSFLPPWNNHNVSLMACPDAIQSNIFHVDSILHDAKYDDEKIFIIQNAFNSAANSVIKALKYQERRRVNKNALMISPPSPSLNQQQPPILEVLQKLDEIKNECFDMALNNSSNKSSKRNSSTKNVKKQDSAASKTKKRRTINQNDDGGGGEKPASSDLGKSNPTNTSFYTLPNSNEKTKQASTTTSSSCAANSNNLTVHLAGSNNTDSRSTVSRAILCAAATLVFEKLTPKLDGMDDIDVLDVPQNKHNNYIDNDNPDETKVGSSSKKQDFRQEINMGAVTMSAEIFAKRAMEQVCYFLKETKLRRKWRMDCAKRELTRKGIAFTSKSKKGKLSTGSRGVNGVLEKWLACKDRCKFDGANCVTESSDDEGDTFELNNRQMESIETEEWTERCLPRLLDIMQVGPGHAILNDLQWNTRFHRVAQILTGLGTSSQDSSPATSDYGTNGKSKFEPNYGPHLIITAEAYYASFMSTMAPFDYSLTNDAPFYLRSLGYNGGKSKRRRIRKEHFTPIGFSGIPDAPYNVIVTTYESFIQDYIHLCQIPFQAVILDDGMSWLGCANYDPNGQLGKVFDKGIWNQSDYHAGLTSMNNDDWDFSLDVNADGSIVDLKDKIGDVESKRNERKSLGLSARHRIIIASSMHSIYRDTVYTAPVPGLLSHFIPQLVDVIKEEWDRSRIQNCVESIEHIRKLVCRGVVVYSGYNESSENMYEMALATMAGKLDSTDVYDTHSGSISTDQMISDGKIVQSRRSAASWLRPGSPIRYELGSTPLDPIINAMKAKAASGFICEEIVTASSLTSSGAGGTISGAAAYKSAVRCGRTFASEQGLRQHISALHAPPGTWLCRRCSIDCGTSQARTHHERSCGSDAATGMTSGRETSLGGGVPTVGQTSKKKKSSASKGINEGKDSNGCIRVPGYRGVWVNPKGKHFVKINKKPLLQDRKNVGDSNDEATMLFESIDEAARMHDSVVIEKSEDKNVEMNFKADGTRIVYDDASSTAAAGRKLEMLGGGASSVVPALSVINIKDLPKGVVPLLRDPKQTPRTGANAKRYVYAYRGVCRQARKGHDRWQSQISFGGTNHYLGTFDSEWDAAAIYSWAHLILYGEEATKKAQKEGEEAVATYEQEQKDIAEGKIPTPLPPKKKKAKTTSTTPRGGRGKKKKEKKTNTGIISKSQLSLNNTKPIIPQMASDYHHGVKVVSLEDNALAIPVSARILASRKNVREGSFHCVPVSKSTQKFPDGCAILVGLSSAVYGWSITSFYESMRYLAQCEQEELLSTLQSEFGQDGMNVRFRTVVKGIPCFIGKASTHLEQAASFLGFYDTSGGTIGDVDCNIGGVDGSCSEMAACISYFSSENSFYLTACGPDDFITVDGVKVTASTGSIEIENGSIISVGCRVFMFILPSQC
mmetsp:Transcript_13247/g.15409  ORF Transcript_13247/g.15409 Transcript_13247/m.15409 type:complete len:1475 (+) Transcript_13247:140-4564(+)